jgi:hypothetical protein
VTKEAGGWFRATTSLLGRIGFGVRDILLNIHLERCLRLRNLHGDASHLKVWWYAWVYHERWQTIEIDSAFFAFRRGNQIVRSRRAEWNDLESNFLGIS